MLRNRHFALSKLYEYNYLQEIFIAASVIFIPTSSHIVHSTKNVYRKDSDQESIRIYWEYLHCWFNLKPENNYDVYMT